MTDQPTTVAARDLVRILKDTIPFGSARDDLPTINGVYIEASTQGITGTATDRYTLAHSRAECAGQLTEPFFLPLAAAKTVARIFTPPRRVPFGDGPRVAITYDPATQVARFATANDEGPALLPPFGDVGHEVRVRCGTAAFPAYTKLLATAGDAAPDKSYGLNPVLLARFAKVIQHPGEPMLIWQRSRTKPMIVQIGDRFIGVIMPVRMPDGMFEGPTVPVGHRPVAEAKPAAVKEGAAA